MKIVVLTGLARTLILFRARLLEAMVSAGHQVVACAPENDPEIAYQLDALGVAYLSIPLKRAGLNPFADFTFFLRLFRYLRRERPDLLFAYTIKSVIYGSFAARLAGVKNVYSMISGVGYALTKEDAGRPWLPTVARSLYRLALSNNRAVFFQNPDDRALFLGFGLVRKQSQAVLVNGSGVDPEHFGFCPPTAGSPTFLLIARMLKDKGIVEYVEAARLVRKKYPEVAFRLIGPFDLNPASLKPEQVAAWQSEGIVEYEEWLKDVRPALAEASVFVLPSYREGTPVAVLEAMAVGRPVVTTDVPGCRETVIEGENGFLIPAKDPVALAEAMERFILQPDLVTEMGRRSRQIAEEKFDVNKVNAVMLKTMGL